MSKHGCVFVLEIGNGYFCMCIHIPRSVMDYEEVVLSLKSLSFGYTVHEPVHT